VTGVPEAVKRISGLLPRLPMRMSCWYMADSFAENLKIAETNHKELRCKLHRSNATGHFHFNNLALPLEMRLSHVNSVAFAVTLVFAHRCRLAILS